MGVTFVSGQPSGERKPCVLKGKKGVLGVGAHTQGTLVTPLQTLTYPVKEGAGSVMAIAWPPAGGPRALPGL
jgi:hypothetical protein